MTKKIAIGNDHAGFGYKTSLVEFLTSQGYQVQDFGAYGEASVDYPDYAHPLAQSIENQSFDFGILICGSGNGVAITANKYQGVRAALCWNEELATLARQHNNANVLCIPARFIDIALAKSMVQVFLHTDFEGGRHANRVAKIGVCN